MISVCEKGLELHPSIANEISWSFSIVENTLNRQEEFLAYWINFFSSSRHLLALNIQVKYGRTEPPPPLLSCFEFSYLNCCII